MNIREIYVFNRALDGEDIMFMPSFKEFGISDIVADAVKEGLIKRELLKDYNEFTEAGLRITDRIRRYKSAKKHIKIDNLMIGILNEEESIQILWNPLFEEYSISMINSAVGARQIAESYDFLMEEGEEFDNNKEKLKYNEVLEKFKLDPDASFKLSSSLEDGKSEEIYFRANGRLYVYDCLEHILYSKNIQGIMASLEERMNIL